jgi:hypothetical protein
MFSLNELSTEELLEIMPGRCKYWEVPGRWTNDWWLQINQAYAKVGVVNQYGRPKNTWYADYVDDDDKPLREGFPFHGSLKEALIELLEYLKENNLYDYRADRI